MIYGFLWMRRTSRSNSRCEWELEGGPNISATRAKTSFAAARVSLSLPFFSLLSFSRFTSPVLTKRLYKTLV